MSSFSFPFPINLSLPLRSLASRLSLPLPRFISLYLPSSRLRLHGFSTRLMASLERKHRIAEIASSIRVIPDFPKPGVMFQDITTLLLDPKAFGDAVELFVERYRDQRISVVAVQAITNLQGESSTGADARPKFSVFGIEARGFIFGPPIALAIGAKFVPLRKPKKLPGEVISEEYLLEYGADKIEMHVGAVQPNDRAIVIDDLIATGGTLRAAVKLLERVGAEVVECACVIELPELKGREKLGDIPLFVLVNGA